MSQVSFPTSPRRARRIPPAATFIATAIGFAFLFLLGIALGVRGWDVALLGLALMTGFVGIMPLLFDVTRPAEERQLLITAIAFAYVLFYVGPVFTQYFWSDRTNINLMNICNHLPQDIAAAQAAALGGLICMIAGFYVPLGRSISRRLPKLEPEWSHRTVLIVALVMAPIGWAVFIAGQSGLVPARAGSGALGIVAKSLYIAIMFLTLAFIRYRSGPALLLLLLMVPPTMVAGFFTGSKRLVLSPLFMVALAYTVVERRIRMSFVLGGLAVLIVIYPVTMFYREVVMRGNTLRSMQVLQDPGRAFSLLSGFVSSFELSEYMSAGGEATGARLDALGPASTIIRDTPSRVPYQRGWSIGLVLIAPIPRVLWPGKPLINIGQWVTDNYGPGPIVRSATGASWIGELYFNFSYPGVIVGMFLLGTWFRFFQEHFFRPDATIPSLVVACLVIEATAKNMSGFLLGPVQGPIWLTLFIASIHFMVRLLSPVPRRPMLAKT